MAATPKKWWLVLPLVLVPTAFLAALPWLKMVSGGIGVLVGAATAGIFVMGYANYLTFLFRRDQDEVQKASAGVAAQWGMAAGQFAFVLLLTLPPFLHFATSLVRNLLGDPGAAEQVVILAMTLGFCGLVLLQGIGTVVVHALWWKSKQ